MSAECELEFNGGVRSYFTVSGSSNGRISSKRCYSTVAVGLISLVGLVLSEMDCGESKFCTTAVSSTSAMVRLFSLLALFFMPFVFHRQRKETLAKKVYLQVSKTVPHEGQLRLLPDIRKIDVPKGLSSRFFCNLTIAHELMRLAENVFDYVPNFPLRKMRARDFSKEIWLQKVKKLDSEREKMFWLDKAGQVKNIEKMAMGNCKEFALVIESIAQTHCPQLSVVSIECAFHIFNVIDIGEYADPRDPRSWNPDALVLDGWRGTIHLPSQIPSYLFGYIDSFSWDAGIPYPTVSRYNAKTDRMNIVTHSSLVGCLALPISLHKI